MSVIPVPDTPDLPDTGSSAPRLHLVAGHEHAWELRDIEYDQGFEVRRYECADCDEVLFR